jgi:hypothetical protein
VFEIGVTLIKLLMGKLDELIAVKAGMFPIPLGESPELALLLVHWYKVPCIVDPENTISFIGCVAQTT